MLHKMSEIRGWTHEVMMGMDKPVFYRYYGYWQADRLHEEEAMERAEFEAKRKEEEQNRTPQWKRL